MLAAALQAILQRKHVPGVRNVLQDTDAWPVLMYLTIRQLLPLFEPPESFQGESTGLIDPVHLSSFLF